MYTGEIFHELNFLIVFKLASSAGLLSGVVSIPVCVACL